MKCTSGPGDNPCQFPAVRKVNMPDGATAHLCSLHWKLLREGVQAADAKEQATGKGTRPHLHKANARRAYLTIRIQPEIKKQIAEWAEQERRTTSSVAAFLLEGAVVQKRGTR
jgi:hypothetical protein